jgi:thiol-disulfide isomerase/thioredoxin
MAEKKEEKIESNLLEFYGTECVHCRFMNPLIERLEAETGLKIKKMEVWHNERNAQLLQQIDRDFCGGVPFFFNVKTGKWICGSASYEKLKEWALGK